MANKQGHVTFDDIMDAADRFSLPIQVFDWLSSSITTYGIIVYSEKPVSTKHAFNNGDDGRERTLEEVGQKMGVTRERIRQIESSALRELRHPSIASYLKDFLRN